MSSNGAAAAAAATRPKVQQPEAFIHTIPDEEATGETKRWYDKARNGDGTLDNVASIHGINPASGDAHWAMYKQSMRGDSPLTLAEREMIGVACAVTHRCGY